MAKPDINKIRKKYGTTPGGILVPDEEILRLPSRILPINYITGGGIPYGVIMEEFGWESTGKSLLAADFAVVTQALGGKVLWDDAEYAFKDSAAFYTGLGLDPDAVELLEDDTVEVFSDWAMDMIKYYRSILTKNEPILLVCDSIAALECEEAQGTNQQGSKREMGNRAKAIYAFYRKRRKLMKKLGVCVIMINQVRDKVGASMFEESTTTPGGAATKFYSSIRLALLKGKQIKEGNDKVGNHVHCFVKKNKTAPPREKAVSQVYFTDNDSYGSIGYHRTAGLGAILKAHKIIKKKGGSYVIKGHDLGKSMTGLDVALLENGKARKAAIKALDINTVSKTRAKLEGLKKNLFPVPVEKAEKKSKGDE